MPPKDFEVAIVGGGIAGVTLALHLLSHDIKVRLYEQAAQFGEIGAGVSFGPNSVRALGLISPDLVDAFAAAETRNQSPAKRDAWFDFRYGEACEGRHTDGGLIRTLECEGGQRGVRRSDLLDNLVRLLPDDVAVFSKHLDSLAQDGDGVTLKFHDGTEARHDVVIGCDGIKSRVRVVLLGDEDPAARAVFSGKYAYRGLIPMDQAKELLGPELAGNSQMWLGRHGHVLTFPINHGDIMNVVAFGSAETWDEEHWVKSVDKQQVVDEYRHWGRSVRSIIDCIQEPDVWALFDHPPARTYHAGLVCIAGDAAHATTPHKGGGAGMAVEDSYILGGLLAAVGRKDELPAALEAFSQSRIARTQRLVADSRQQGRLFELEEGLEGAEELAENIGQRMRWLWDHDIAEELDEAKKDFRVRVAQLGRG